MFKLSKTIFASAAVAAAVFVAGCQSTGASQATASTPPLDKAVACSKCEVTYVKVPVDGGKGRIVGYSTKKTMECPDCKSAVENFFATGELKHTCRTCGDTMSMCETH